MQLDICMQVVSWKIAVGAGAHKCSYSVSGIQETLCSYRIQPASEVWPGILSLTQTANINYWMLNWYLCTVGQGSR